jgi:hypothetical protein
MLGNLIGGFVFILVAIAIVTPITNEINSAMCPTNVTITTNTNSFGGAGAQFGGFDGELKHDNFATKNGEIATGICSEENSMSLTLLKIVPALFSLCIMAVGIFWAYSALSECGIL